MVVMVFERVSSKWKQLLIGDTVLHDHTVFPFIVCFDFTSEAIYGPKECIRTRNTFSKVNLRYDEAWLKERTHYAKYNLHEPKNWLLS
jgi:hypothetical protein